MKNLNKLLGLGMLVMALVFGMAVIGCDDGGDTWEPVSDISQLNGRWKGSYYSGSMSIDEYSGETTGVVATISITMEIDITINSSAQTMSRTMTQKMTVSGRDAEAVWLLLSLGMDGEPGVNINNSTKTITMTQTIPAGSPLMFDAEDIAEMEINKAGNKIRVKMVEYIEDDDGTLTTTRTFVMTKQ